MAKNKYAFSDLALCNWLFTPEPGEIRFLTRYSLGTHNEYRFHVATRPEGSEFYEHRVIGNESASKGITKEQARQEMLTLQKSLGGRFKDTSGTLHRDGVISQSHFLTKPQAIENFQKHFSNLNLDRYSLTRGTKKGHEWWNQEGKFLYEAEKAKRDKKRDDAERTILIGAWITYKAKIDSATEEKLSFDIRKQIPLPTRKVFRPFATATVIKESQKRLQIENVEILDSFADRRWGSGYDIEWPLIGDEPNMFIDRESLMLEHPDEAVVDKLTELHREGEQSFRSVARSHIDEIIPLILKMNNHLQQQSYAVEDETKEIIERFQSNNNATRRP